MLGVAIAGWDTIAQAQGKRSLVYSEDSLTGKMSGSVEGGHDFPVSAETWNVSEYVFRECDDGKGNNTIPCLYCTSFSIGFSWTKTHDLYYKKVAEILSTHARHQKCYIWTPIRYCQLILPCPRSLV